MTSELSVLSVDECLALLGACDVGRIAVIDEAGYPAVFPVSYRLVLTADRPLIALRTRHDNVIDRPDTKVSIQIDGVDNGHDAGWSVLVRGILDIVEPDSRIDSHPLLDSERDAWRVVVPTRITGRCLIGDLDHWSFHPLGYI